MFQFRPLSLVLVISFFCTPISWTDVWAEESVVDVATIVARMASSSRQLNYQGIFTYEHAGILRSVQVAHIIHNDIEYERLLYLNGPRREIVQRSQVQGCSSTDDEPVSGGTFKTLPLNLSLDVAELSTHYSFYRRNDDRIADRSVWVIHLVPKDIFRYGFVLAIDQKSGLLLQSLLLGTNNRVLERFQFVTVSLGVNDSDTETYFGDIINNQSPDSAPCNPPKTPSDAPSWQASWLPPGFSLLEAGREENGVETGLFSDGLSMFSVFIDPQGGKQLPEVQAQRGATVLKLTKIRLEGQDYAICVVGEVPAETAKRVANYVRLTLQ